MAENMKPEVFGGLSYEEQNKAINEYMVSAEIVKTERSCGDGRKAQNGTVFIKNFGGSLGAATVYFVSKWRQGEEVSYKDAVNEALDALAKKFDLGGHRDDHSHGHETSSGCGYADNRTAIVNRIANTEGFDGVINSVFKDAINDNNRELWNGVLNAYKAIAKAQGGAAFTPTGEQLISTLEEKDSSILMLEGAHEEYAIVFNDASGYTLDTNKLVEDGGSAFCVDIWDAMAQSDFLGIDSEEARLIYMAEWVATALVLVVDKGKDLPPIFFVPADFHA